MPRYLMVHRGDAESEAGSPPSAELMEKMNVLMEDIAKAGVMEATEGLQPSAKATRIRYENGQFLITDGPFAETKEIIASYALVNVAGKDEAIYWAKRFYEVLGQGEGDIYPIKSVEDFGPELASEIREQEGRMRAQLAQNQAR